MALHLYFPQGVFCTCPVPAGFSGSCLAIAVSYECTGILGLGCHFLFSFSLLAPFASQLSGLWPLHL